MFMKKALKRHGKPGKIVTDGLRSYLRRCVTWAISTVTRRAAGSTIGPKIRICPSYDETGQCCGFGR
jgi:hypothetical protein